MIALRRAATSRQRQPLPQLRAAGAGAVPRSQRLRAGAVARAALASGVARVVAGALTDRNSALRAHRACERRSSHGRPPRDPSENGPRPKTK